MCGDDCGTGWLSPLSLPFLIVLFECGDFVVSVSSEGGLRGGVVGWLGASGERGRRCPHSC